MLYFSDNPDLSKEAAGIVIWCLSQNTECYKQWVSIFVSKLSLFEFRQAFDVFLDRARQLIIRNNFFPIFFTIYGNLIGSVLILEKD